MDERKAALLDALAARCTALLDRLQDQPGQQPAVDAETGASPAGAEPTAADEAASAAGGGGKLEGAEPPGGSAAAVASAPGSAAVPAAGGQDREAFEASFRELRKWVDTAADEKVRARLGARL
jgi:hypothetical protein